MTPNIITFGTAIVDLAARYRPSDVDRYFR